MRFDNVEVVENELRNAEPSEVFGNCASYLPTADDMALAINGVRVKVFKTL